MGMRRVYTIKKVCFVRDTPTGAFLSEKFTQEGQLKRFVLPQATQKNRKAAICLCAPIALLFLKFLMFAFINFEQHA